MILVFLYNTSRTLDTISLHIQDSSHTIQSKKKYNEDYYLYLCLIDEVEIFSG